MCCKLKVQMVFNNNETEDHMMFAYGIGKKFQGEEWDMTKDDVMSVSDDSDMTDVVEDLNDYGSKCAIDDSIIETIGNHLLILLSVQPVVPPKITKHFPQKPTSSIAPIPPKPPSIPQPSTSPQDVNIVGKCFQNLNLRKIFVTKMKTTEAETLMNEDIWYSIRTKVNKDIPQNAIIMIVTGKYTANGCVSISDIKQKILGELFDIRDSNSNSFSFRIDTNGTHHS